nr:PREDICTED: girdin-like [Linepithema humile]
MEEIRKLKEKHVKINVSVLENLLSSQTEITDEFKRKQDQQLNEVDIKIEQATSKLDLLKKTLCRETQILEQKNSELSKQNDYLKELETEKKKLLQEVKQLEREQNKLKSAKPSDKDQHLLEQGMKNTNCMKI